MSFWICATCAVEHAERTDVCAICADERQWVPADGQRWTTLTELADDGCRTSLVELEPDLWGVSSRPGVGIGQQSKLVRTSAGCLLFDPIGFLDGAGVEGILDVGPVVAIVASHPHMYGVQVEWSRALGGVPVLVAEKDREWVARPDPVVQTWSDDVEILPGVTLTQPGGHFPGSTVAHWAQGADGRGVLLSGDTIYANPDRSSVSFMRSFPNRLPLSGAVVERIATSLERFEFDRLYGNFDNVIPERAREIVRWSANRHIGWARGDFDSLT
ncbi:Metallo-beta-lactamase superfamily protein [Microbacterium sp. cf046]|uniref:MBL fold metallo-hydrolase n=1 Tax=Microbacterium sp. cf046 TaxID=1761803 RepID=UPI0008EDB59D|nr:MBL fold metallo-hydrolase [Microbacterium sp. cf046]SFR93371.1 Metallo-beta-lactamase superfamily protein [Microbacterium sp. cf046]